MFNANGRKTVRTGVYGKNVAVCLDRFFSTLDGKVRFPHNMYISVLDLQFDLKLLYFAAHAAVSTEPDNEIVLTFGDRWREAPVGRSKDEIFALPDGQIVRLLADLIQEALPYLKYMLSNGAEFNSGFGSVEEYKCLIKILRKQKPGPGDDPAVVEKLFDERYDPFRTEMEIKWRQEKKDAHEKYVAAKNEIYGEFNKMRAEFALKTGGAAENDQAALKYELDLQSRLKNTSIEFKTKLNEIDSSYEKILKRENDGDPDRRNDT